MPVSPEYVKELAARARLSLNDKECVRYAQDIGELELLCAPLLCDGGERDETQSVGTLDSLREDVVGECLPREAIEKMAPVWEDGCFSVPRAVTGGDENG